jgi:hypothetical protein
VEDIIRGHPELAVWTILILAVATCYIVKVLAGQWRAVQQAELEIGLKEQMIQRGMSAAEIAQVLHAPAEPAVRLEAERPVPAYVPRRPCSSGKGWLWAAIGVPVAMVVLCSGLFMALASVVVVEASESVTVPATDAVRVVPPEP